MNDITVSQETQAVSQESQDVAQLHWVGVGSSAGGLEALSEWIRHLPEGLDCIYLIAQHMSPKHRSMMVDILSRETTLLVNTASDGAKPEPGQIYIIPPGYNLIIREQCFHLQPSVPEVSPKPSINLLFQSLAENFGENAIGIVLSGTGSDGAAGLRAIKAGGGIAYAQQPESAKYDGMPRSAIETGMVDRILSPQDIGPDLQRVLHSSQIVPPNDPTSAQSGTLAQLFGLVREHTKIDFSSYKLTTVFRRLQRRFLATETEGLSDYLAFVKENPDELDNLAKETLISVTSFFRDQDSQRKLENHLKVLIAGKNPGEEVRVWVVGCATGEEAYSLAMLCLEHIDQHNSNLRLQVFATDIDNDALAHARRGFFSTTAMTEVPDAFIKRYFRQFGQDFEPTKRLRDCIVFARQDIVSDPPFLKVDLVSCRNVLIYFNPDLQHKVLNTLHFALNAEGLLFLGKSENVGQNERFFTALDRRARIFQRRSEGSSKLPVTQRGRLPLTLPAKKQDSGYQHHFYEAVRQHYAPYAFLVDMGFNILYMHGTGKGLVEMPTGQPDMNLAQIIVPEFRNELLTCLHNVRQQQTSASSRARRIASLDFQVWTMTVHPVAHPADAEWYLVALHQTHNELPAPAAQPVDEMLTAGDEIENVQMQALLEEMAASNEEMQALNEEVQASNEELQATNEELEAANEELQATNQELISVNEENQLKSSELAALNSEFENLYNSIDFPVLVFDLGLSLTRVNKAARRIYDIPGSYQHRTLAQLDLPDYLQDLDKRLEKAIASQRRERYQAFHQDRVYQLYLAPTLNSAGTSQSVVVFVIDNTELSLADQRVKETQERLLAILNHSPYLVALKDTAGRYQFANYRFSELFGVQTERIIGYTDQQIFAPEMAKMLRKGDLEAMEKQQVIHNRQALTLGAREVLLESTYFPIYDSHGVVQSICLQAIDNTEKHQAEEQLRMAAKVFDRAGEAIMITDAKGHIMKVNDVFSQITGYAAAEVIGKNPSILQSGQHDASFYQIMWKSIQETGGWQGEITNRRADGSYYPEWLTISSVHDGSGNVLNYVGIFSDISAMKASQNQIQHMATHDDLTGLPNRTLLMDRLKHHIAVAKRKNELIAVLFIDLDNFKNVNDALGHDAGDILLKQASSRLLACLRGSDTLARLGGDEFVALLIDIDASEINPIAVRIVDSLSASFHIYDRDCYVSCSMGISVFPQDGEDSTTLVKNADTAMYRAKELGRNQFQYFADEMKLKALQRLTLETGLRLALEHGDLFLHYQPKINLRDGQVAGAEALLRWQDANMGYVSPAQFIPVAEQCGLINRLGLYVIDQALNDIKSWHKQGLNTPPIAINLSVHQLRDPGFFDQIQQRIKHHQLPASVLTLEITESMLMERLEETRDWVVQLSRAGFKISIDDFGTGYSSLAYLKQLPIDELKVDRSFINKIDTEVKDRGIADAIIHMAHVLDLQVVAEGVETESQLRVLQALDCDQVQGYYYHRPMPANQIQVLLSEQLLIRC
ncbi:MAG: EAL domain-containing protein [Methylococcales bacterium]|nr:EAL domain-containing protein [Methylococcales bacterium]